MAVLIVFFLLSLVEVGVRGEVLSLELFANDDAIHVAVAKADRLELFIKNG